MNEYVYAFLIFFLFFALLCYNYGNYAVTVVKWSKKPRFVKKNGKKVMLPGKVNASEKMLCYIPIAQVVQVRKALYYRMGPLGVTGTVGIVLIILRLIITFFTNANPYIQLFSIFGLFIGIILVMLTYGLVTADCAKMYGFAMSTVVLNFLFPCIFCFWQQNNIADAMRKMHKEEIFNEHSDDTISKQRHSG